MKEKNYRRKEYCTPRKLERERIKKNQDGMEHLHLIACTPQIGIR